MDGFFISEALSIGLREGLKAGLVWIVLLSLFDGEARASVSGVLLAALGAYILCFFIPYEAGLAMDTKLFTARLYGYVFFLLFFASSIVLLMYPGTGFGRGEERLSGSRLTLIAILVFVFFVPDAIVSSCALRELVVLKQNASGVYTSAGAVFVSALGAFMYLSSSRRFALWRYFGPGQ